MPGATSLVELILKKWGAPAAGVAAAGQSDDADAGVSGVIRNAQAAVSAINKAVKGGAGQRNKIAVLEKIMHDNGFSNYDEMGEYAIKVDGDTAGDYWKGEITSMVDQLREAGGLTEEADGHLQAWLEDHLSRDKGWRPPKPKPPQERARAPKAPSNNAMALALAAAAGSSAASADEGLPLPTAGDIADSLFTVLGMPMAGLQGLARGAYGLLSGEDLVTAAAEANHMTGGSLLGDIGRPGGDTEEGWDRIGSKVESLLEPLDKQFPYLGLGKAAGDTTSLGLSLLSPF